MRGRWLAVARLATAADVAGLHDMRAHLDVHSDDKGMRTVPAITAAPTELNNAC